MRRCFKTYQRKRGESDTKRLSIVAYLLLMGMLLVGFKGNEIKFTRNSAAFTGLMSQQKQMIPSYTEVATFEMANANTLVYFQGQYGYVAAKDLVTYQELQKLEPKPNRRTLYEDHTDSSSIILIGDSKTAQMHSVVDTGKVTWIAKEGAGYEWLTQIATPMVDDLNLTGKRIYIMTGINDLIGSGFSSYQSYLYFMFTKAQEWEGKGAEVIFVSVSPIQYYENVSNELIGQYNNSIKESLPANIEYLDIYSMLCTWGKYITVDGLHYDANTYRVVFSTLL